MELTIEVPVDDMTDLDSGTQRGGDASAVHVPRRSIWPAIAPRLLELIRAHRSTIVFVNSRRLAERLSGQLNDLAGEELVRAHHGSIAREQRTAAEEMLKEGRMAAIVATSSLELGIDMGAVDLVVQVGSPLTVAAGLQRIGRAGHSVGVASRGTIFPTHRGDLVEAAAIAERMLEGAIEETRVPRNPLDVLAQQIVAMAALDTWDVDDLLRTILRAYPFSDLSPRAFEATLDMLDGRYPSEEFAELRARVVWDRVAGTVRGRAGAQLLAVTSGGTIPDRGLYSVNIFEDGRRVGAEQLHDPADRGQSVLGDDLDVRPLLAQLSGQRLTFTDEVVDTLDKLVMVGAVEQINVVDVGAFEIGGEDKSRRAGLADDLAKVDVLGVLFDEEAAERFAGFEMDDIVFPLVAAGGRGGGEAQRHEDGDGGRRHIIPPAAAAGD